MLPLRHAADPATARLEIGEHGAVIEVHLLAQTLRDDGDVYELPDYDIALAGLSAPAELATLRLAKPLTV
jgi:hypothetical protein